MNRADITRAMVMDLLDYSPETGKFTWRVNRRGKALVGAEAGSVDGYGYIAISVFNIRFLAHRLAWLVVYGGWPALQLDHINRNKKDNSIGNLREVTGALNKQNHIRPMPNNSLGLIGVTPERGRFKSVLTANGVTRFLGRFSTPELAHAAYMNAKRALDGSVL
ncbi:HNH endonuclease signature motif containing protein [Polaromonas sp.]|uniref:HNH endonuclease signature motif containing protein n=1 Tax=Polaromonas sp. TaxID=1869339 RepID=UPI0032631D57